MAIYCSKECRKFDWQMLHRKVCNASYVPESEMLLGHLILITQLTECRILDEHIRQRDLQCAVSILSSETYRHRRGLKALAHRKFPGTPLSDLKVVIDYTTRKLVFDVQHNLQDDITDDELEDKADESQEVTKGVAKIDINSDTGKNREPDNRFLMLWVKLRQGTMSLHAMLGRARELQVPDDNDLRAAVALQGLRVQGVDKEGNPLATTWDEIDETLYRIETFGGGDYASIPLCSFDHLISNHAGWVEGEDV